jgi:aminoglycoside phosphotransferase (APT) family kinase protein
MDQGKAPGASRLLAYLKRATNTPALAYQEKPELISEGFEARVFGFRLANAPDWAAQRLVLRVVHTSIEGTALRREKVVHNTLAAMGYPAPRVLIAEPDTASLGAPFYIAERLPGAKLDHFRGQHKWHSRGRTHAGDRARL